jgi:hypothetical protein
MGSAVVARAAVELNWDLHISPARSGKQGPMSLRGTSFGINFEGLVLVSLGGPRLGREGGYMRKTYTRRLSVQKIILATKTLSR